MACSPTLSDWKTALASGVKIDVLLKSLDIAKKPEAGQTSNLKDEEVSENMKLVGLTEDPLEFKWAEPSLRHIDLQDAK